MGDTTEGILEQVLADLAEGREPDEASLHARCPGRDEQVARVLRTAKRYLSATRAGGRAESSPRLNEGDRLGDFEVQGFLGRGGMGQVWRACQLSLGRRVVALKVMPTRDHDDAARQRFEREGLLLSGLHHPSLAEVYGVGECDGLLYLAMRLVEGRTLREVQAALGTPGAADRRRILAWGADLASALALVHANGLVHRDVKPSNVVIEDGPAHKQHAPGVPSGRAVLVDFGLVRAHSDGGGDSDSATRAGAPPATLHYAPPEQLLGDETTPRSDVFALGVTLHDLLSGRTPEERAPASAGLERLDALVDGIDLDLVAIVARAVDPDPRWRFADAGELHRDIRAWLDGRPVSARRRPLRERLWRGVVERPDRVVRGAMAGALALLALLGLLSAFHWVAAGDAVAQAFERGDLLAVARAGEEVPTPLHGTLIRGDGLALVRRIDEASSTDPLATILGHLRRDELPSALLAAATHMRREGYGEDPWVHWFFERTASRLLADRAAESAALRSEAILLIARLCYERPVETPEDLARTARFRDHVRLAWRDEELGDIDRLYALSALGGCGTAEDLGPILEETLDPRLGPEWRRLGLSAATWILLRLPSLDALTEAQLERAIAALRPHARELLARPESIEGNPPDVLASTAMGLALRLARFELHGTLGPSVLLDELPAAWWRGLDDGTIRPRCVNLLAGLGDPRLRAALPAWVEDPEQPVTDLLRARRLGAWARSVGDEAYSAQLEQRLAGQLGDQAPAAEVLESFRLGVRAATAFDSGIPDNHRLDADTLLGSEAAVLDVQRLPSVRDDASQPTASRATWSLRSDPVRLAGSARGVRVRGAGLAIDETALPYLRLPHFGSSTVVLEFELDEAELGAGALLRLDHLSARRDVYPFHGQAFLDVRLNGFSVIEKLPVEPLRASDRGLALRDAYLRPGPNEIELRLHAATTTTYRLKSAELRTRD